MWNTDLGLEAEGIILRASLWVVTSLWSQKVSHSSRIYSAREKLMLISDQARDFVVKILFWRPACMCPFQNSSSTSGILNESTESEKFTCDDLWGESESYWTRVIRWYFARIKCVNIVPGWLWVVLTVPRTRLIVRFPEVVDRQNWGMSWCSCYKNIVYKHEKAFVSV